MWLFATLACAYLGYSLATVAYQAWGAELAHDDAGRTRVTGSREGAGLIGVLIGGTVPTVAGMPALVAIFIVVLATRLLDAVIDPLLGSWVDLQRLRGSSLRPILLGSLPLAAGFALLFNPRLAGGAATITTVWLFATLACAYLGYLLATVAYQAWGAELAHDDAVQPQTPVVRRPHPAGDTRAATRA